MTVRSTIDYAAFLRSFPNSYRSQIDKLQRKTIKAMLGVPISTHNLSAWLDSGIPPIKYRIERLGWSYAMACEERKLEVESNPYIEATWWITRKVREEAAPAYKSYELHKKTVNKNRAKNAAPNGFAAKISFAAYLALDWDGKLRREINERTRRDLNANSGKRASKTPSQ